MDNINAMKATTVIKNFILLVALIGLVTSCSIFKNKSKTKDIQKSVELVEIEYKENIQTDIKVKDKEVDKDINTVTTETTTKKTTKGTDIKVTADKSKINQNGETILYDSIGRKIVLQLDSVKQALTISIEAPEVTEETTTRKTEQQDRSKERERDSTDKTNKIGTLVQRDEKEQYVKKVTSESNTSLLGIIGLFLGIGVLIVGIYFVIKKKLF